jgi:hypothetical protein
MPDLNNIDWITTGPIIGESDPEGRSDSFNKSNKQIWANYLNEHDKDGDHKADLLSYYMAHEEFYYSGNSTDDTNVYLSDTDLDIDMIWLWSADYGYMFFRSESMAGDNTQSTDNVAFVANYIQSVGTGTFQLGDDNNVNDTGTTYYGIAWGHH